MRAKRSCPRSSVPNGCLSEGPARRALKSMSLIGTFQSHGPTSTPKMMMPRMTVPKSASLWRRKRRHASAPQRTFGREGAPPARISPEGDTGIEPAIEHVGDEVEHDDQAGEDERHRHDHGRVVGEDRADEERADAGDAEDLLGDDGATEDRGHAEGYQR